MDSGAIAIAVGALLTAGVAAWVVYRKQRAEERNGVIKEWMEIANRLQKEIEELNKKTEVQNQRINSLVQEVATLRLQIEKRETERIDQRTDLREQGKAVDALKEEVSQLKQPEDKP